MFHSHIFFHIRLWPSITVSLQPSLISCSIFKSSDRPLSSRSRKCFRKFSTSKQFFAKFSRSARTLAIHISVIRRVLSINFHIRSWFSLLSYSMAVQPNRHLFIVYSLFSVFYGRDYPVTSLFYSGKRNFRQEY